jgi:hypothetical protein
LFIWDENGAHLTKASNQMVARQLARDFYGGPLHLHLEANVS